MLKILYFARLREQLGSSGEQLGQPEALGVHSIGELRNYLCESRPASWQALRDPATRAAVNQVLADDATPLSSGDEVAFFPPVTGG